MQTTVEKIGARINTSDKKNGSKGVIALRTSTTEQV